MLLLRLEHALGNGVRVPRLRMLQHGIRRGFYAGSGQAYEELQAD